MTLNTFIILQQYVALIRKDMSSFTEIGLYNLNRSQVVSYSDYLNIYLIVWRDG